MSLIDDYTNAAQRGDIATCERIATTLDSEDAARHARLDLPTALLSAALWYGSAGIAIFPLEPRGKRPITRNGFKDATTDPATITAWWEQTPDANIGAPTGTHRLGKVTFDVVDVDGYEGIHSMWLTPERYVDHLHIIGHATTSRPGGHHLFVPPRGLGNKTALYPGVDFRGAGGYVVMPPSVGATGRRYAWLRPLDLTATQATA